MGGRIWVEAQNGRGSEFFFTCVFGLEGKELYGIEVPGFKGLKVLAWDSYSPALEVLVKDLGDLGFDVAEAGSMEEILELARGGQTCVAAVIGADVKDLDGSGMAQAFEQTGGPKLIMVVNEDITKFTEQTKWPWSDRVLAKPLTLRSLANMFSRVLGLGPIVGKTDSRLSEIGKDIALVEEVKGAKILLAEDNDINQLVATRLLKKAGFEVEVAGNGLEAVEKVRSRHYDLVLMDIQMPEMDGLTATRVIRKLPGFDELPIVAMTAHAMSGDREESLAAGMNDHITKPINLRELFATLNRWLDKEKRPHDAKSA
jgi:CheY-like chemotaxis protein